LEELNLRENQKRNGLLDLVIILGVLSGSLFDAADLFLNTSLSVHGTVHYALKDLQTLSLSILAFTLCSYGNIKIKAFLFMFSIWRFIVFGYNIYLPDFQHQYLMIPLNAIYIIWILRTLTVDSKKPDQQELDNLNKEYGYNILFPVLTFRGLLQILFTFNNPKYETRMALYYDEIFLVYKNKFMRKIYDKEKLEELINKSGAIIKAKRNPTKIYDIYNLMGKKSIFGIRDCRRLEL